MFFLFLSGGIEKGPMDGMIFGPYIYEYIHIYVSTGAYGKSVFHKDHSLDACCDSVAKILAEWTAYNFL